MTLWTLALAAQLALAPAGWQVRYANQPDQKPEWNEAGYLPRFQLDWTDRERPEVTFQDDEDGDCRGYVFLAKPWTVPDPLPAEVRVSLEYRTSCALNDPPMTRSGTLAVLVATAEGWSKLDETPDQAPPLDPRTVPGVLLLPVHPQGEDVPDWTLAKDLSVLSAVRALGGRELYFGIAWGTYHYGADEHGGVRNIEVEMIEQAALEHEFWDALDLDQPGLAQVKAALANDDLDAATDALADHFRTRTAPTAEPLGPSERSVPRADEVLAGTYRHGGCPVYTFPDGKVIWNADPFNYEQWAIALNRHGDWKTLASAYLQTKDPKYATGWAELLNDWIAAMPVLIHKHWIEGPYNTPGRGPLSLDAGIRMGQTWFPTFDVFRHAPEVDSATIVNFVRSCRRHALYLMRPENYKHGSNWAAMESNGLYHIGALLPEFKDAKLWRDTALERLVTEIHGQVYPDGAQTELAPGYHGVSLVNFLGAMKLAKQNHLPLPDDYAGPLQAMFDYYLQIMMPDFRTPPVNDSGAHGIQGWFKDACELFGDRPDYLWAKTSRKEGAPPTFTSCVMPYAGWTMTRSGWGPDDLYLHFQPGSFGTGHQHEDKLSILLSAYGRRLITECGTYAYDESDWRRYALSTRAHSTIRIDGQDQACRLDRSQYRQTEPETHGFRTNEFYDYAVGTQTSGYGPEADRTVQHRRRVVFVKPYYWLMVDDLAASDDAAHTATTQFLLDAPSAEVEPGTNRVIGGAAKPDDPRLVILPLNPEGNHPRIVMGQTEPEVLGFIPHGFEQLTPAPAALYEQQFTGRVTRVYALVPLRDGQVPRMSVDGPVSNQGVDVMLGIHGVPLATVEITPTSVDVVVVGQRLTVEEPALLRQE